LLTQKLVDYGLDTHEAEIYVFLSSIGPAPARVIARKFNFNRMKAYRTLKSLEKKGLIQSTISRPIKFVASPLEAVINRQLTETKMQLSNMEKNQSNIIEEWKKIIKTNSQQLEEPRFRIYQGRQEIYDLMLQMCNRASKNIYLVTTVNDLNRLSYMGLEDQLKACLKKNIRIRILTDIQKDTISEVEAYNTSANVRHLKLPTPIRSLIIDEKEALTTTSMEESINFTTQSDVGLWTTASNFVVAMRIFYEAVWDLSTDSDARIQYLETGILPTTLQTIHDIEEGYSKIREMVKQSTNKLDILVNDLRSITLSYFDLEEAAKKGVKVRLLTHVDEFNLDDISMLSKIVQIKESFTEFNLELVFKDGKELLRIYPLSETGRNIVWSNILPHVETLGIVYEEYWKRGIELESQIKWIQQKNLMNTLKQSLLKMGENAIEKILQNEKIIDSVGKEHVFELIITKRVSSQPLCINIVTEKDVFNKILVLGANRNELNNFKLVLLSWESFKAEEKRLAELYRIQLISESNISKITEKILQL